MNADLGDLFDWVATKVTNVRATSKKAYADLKDEGTLAEQEYKIIKAMKHGWNYSLQEISTLTGIQINAVSGRVNGLKKRGWLVECEKRPCSITGRKIQPVMMP
jgi:hypothetical protein